MIIYAFLAFFISFFLSFLLIYLARKKISIIVTDHLHEGPQKFHNAPTPRLGGLGIFLALLLASILAFVKGDSFKVDFILLVFAAIPAFSAGLLEDVLGKLSAKLRFILIWASGTALYFLLGAKILRLDLPIDYFFKYFVFSYFFTVFALTGLANSINIIDGFNGLASMVSIIIFMALGYVSYKVGDYFLATICITMVGALAGFFILNYPNGLIFLGDGGAYLTGLIIGAISVLLVKRHPQVSAWFPFLVCIYPIFETLFSIYRKKILRKISPFLPDGLHLHMLIYKRLTKWLLGPAADKLRRNAATSPFLWTICLLGVVPALIFWDQTSVLMIFSFLFALLYLYLYWRVLMPRWISKK
ncbi:MAG: glycosyltransferase [Caldimicrobium sp.]|nr:glycosyltransferase [Caldimicrobium sp.]MCX7612786.1 glycosyltransferase [Caldimicrobium sp.]MDW8182138.1 glycosyltransferase [Caldimicrobium sp.]